MCWCVFGVFVVYVVVCVVCVVVCVLCVWCVCGAGVFVWLCVCGGVCV